MAFSLQHLLHYLSILGIVWFGFYFPLYELALLLVFEFLRCIATERKKEPVNYSLMGFFFQLQQLK